MYSVDDITELASETNTNIIVNELSAQDLLLLIKDLPPAYKMVFNLYAIDGYSHKEISEILNISIGTSKSNLSRARKILQNKVRLHFVVPEQRKTC
jgi:RNA polymerase sigma-70 factor (ECF subfamily)